MSELIKGQSREVIHSRLRMVANGNTTINSVRAEHVGSICVSSKKCLKAGISKSFAAKTQNPLVTRRSYSRLIR